jgi:glycosyltransferase involved in cell wall biosynthesis
MITICFTYFRSLTLANLEAALFSVRKQDLRNVDRIIVLDNNTDDSTAAIQEVIERLAFPVTVQLLSCKHGDMSRTHAWSTNAVVAEAKSPWVFFTRADYILDSDAVRKFMDVVDLRGADWNGFVVGGYYDVSMNVHQCEATNWRTAGPNVLQSYGRDYDHVIVDSGVWMTKKEIFERAGGLCETQSAWGHAQTVFQYRVYQLGVEFVRIPHVVFYHTAHGYEVPRDHAVASQQLANLGLNLKELWARYDGPDNPYR